MNTIELLDGETITIRSPKKVSERKRRPVTRLAAKISGSALGRQLQAGMEAEDATITDEDLDLTSDLNDAVALAMIDSWSFKTPDGLAMLPVTQDNLVDLEGPQYDAIRKACAPFINQLMPDFGPAKDAESPSKPSLL